MIRWRRRARDQAAERPPCPPPERWQSFLYGRLTDEDLGELTAHLAQCRQCQARLRDLDDSKRSARKPAVASPDSSVWSLAAALGAIGPPPDKGHFLEKLSQFGKECGLDLSEGWRAILDAAPRPPGSPPPPHSIPRQLGQYQLLDVIGYGGMGIVLRARHVLMKRERALKLLHPGRVANPSDLARFHREIEAVAQLEHPHIVVGHDAQEAQGCHFLVMEFVSGLNLAHLAARVGRLPVADACELVRQAAVGLDYAHTHGIIHRDVKPSNLLLSDRGVVKVLDLGLAAHRDEIPDDERDVVLGTADYIAPEQWTSADTVDRRADVYSLGCTLYQLLVGAPPFGGLPESYRAKADAHRHRPPPPLRAERPDVPLALDILVGQMLAKEPADRPATAAAVAAELGRFTPGCDLAVLLERAGRQPENTAKPARRPLFALLAGKTGTRRMSRRSMLAAGASAVVGGGLLGNWLVPRWSAPRPLAATADTASWAQGHQGQTIAAGAQGALKLTAENQPGLVRLATLESSRYRIAATVTLHPGVEQAGLYFDYCKSSSDAADTAAQAIVLMRGQQRTYGLQCKRLQFGTARGLWEHAATPVGLFRVGEAVSIEVECGPEGVRRVWCNGQQVSQGAIVATRLAPQGEAGLIVIDGAADFRDVRLSARN